MEVFAAKAAVRSKVKLALKVLSLENRNAQSLEVSRKVLENHYYKTSKGVAVFLSMNDEIDTSNIIHDIFDSGKHCYIPR